MNQRTLREDWREPRDWAYVWKDPPGFFLPNCDCCPGGSSQAYHVFGGDTESQSLPAVIRNTNYEWSTGAWSTKATLSTARYWMGSTTPTTTSSAYTFGGLDATTFLSRTDNYTESGNTWATDTAMSTQRYDSDCSTAAINSLGYNWGGTDNSGTILSLNYQLTPGTPSSSSWATKTAMTAARSNGAADYIGTQFGYFFGGFSAGPTQQLTTYRYDTSGNSWSTKTNYPATARDSQSCMSLSSAIYVVNGSPTNLPKINYQYVDDAWTLMATPPNGAFDMPCGRGIDAAGAGWQTGGNDSLGNSQQMHIEYTPNAWSTRTNIPTAIGHGAATPA